MKYFLACMPCNFLVRMLGYFLFFLESFFAHENIKKTGLKGSILMAVWIFFICSSNRPKLLKTAQEWKFVMKMCLKTHLFCDLWCTYSSSRCDSTSSTWGVTQFLKGHSNFYIHQENDLESTLLQFCFNFADQHWFYKF